MKRYQLEQLKVNNNTYLSDLAMQVKISAMKLNRMEVELRNERYLDSLGSGTTDKVRQAELNFNTGKLELEQLRQQYANEKEVKAADLKVKELEFNIFAKSLAEMKRHWMMPKSVRHAKLFLLILIIRSVHRCRKAHRWLSSQI